MVPGVDFLFSPTLSNQYQHGASAGCTYLAAAFVAREQPSSGASPADIDALLGESAALGASSSAHFPDPVDVLDAMRARVAPARGAARHEAAFFMLSAGGHAGLAGALAGGGGGAAAPRGALIVGQSLTLGARAGPARGGVQVFDPHGAAHLTGAGNAAYVAQCADAAALEAYLRARLPLPDLGGGGGADEDAYFAAAFDAVELYELEPAAE